MAQHRHTVNIQLKMSEHGVLSRVLNEPSLRVMVFCAAEGQGRQDVAFPHQSEIKVNGGEVKANLRGLKNKPGSTRPVDITKELRLKTSNPNYQNAVEMTYALTNKVGQSQVSFQTPHNFLTLLSPLPFHVCVAVIKLEMLTFHRNFT